MQENDPKKATYPIREHRNCSFEHSIMLLAKLQTDKARADFRNCILTISLPDAEPVKPKAINIKVK
jgi:HSP20 family protein